MAREGISFDIGTFIVVGFAIGSMMGIARGNFIQWTGAGMCLGIIIGSLIRYK